MNRNNLTQFLAMVLLAALLAITGCGGGSDGSDGTDGVDGADGADGTDGAPGAPGEPGTPGEPGGNVQIQNFHGTSALEEELLVADNKYLVDANITSATADAAGIVTVNFTVENDGVPLPGATGFSFNIDKLVPAPTPSGLVTADEVSYNQWVPYLYRTETAGTHGAAPNDWPATQDGVMVNQASSESNGTLTDHGDGSYTYVFGMNISNITKPVGGAAVAYERNLTHRVSLMMGGHNGPTDDDTFDFVPDGSPVTETRNIVATSGCQGCHGTEFSGHGGNRVSVENCVTCHNPSNTDAQSGNTLDMKVMIHKIHMGGELPSASGTDGILWDDPTTIADESTDNGPYAIWGYRTTKYNWWKPEFPAVIENCTKCHQGGGENENNWKTVLSRAACGSCHENVDFATGVNHDGPLGSGGVQTNDNLCGTCHQREGGTVIGIAPSVMNAHNWTTTESVDPGYDARNVPEFAAVITMSPPANGQYYIAGESPQVYVALNDLATGSPMSMDTGSFFQSAATGCDPTGCPANTAGYAASNFFVQGPRGLRVPVLTTAARAEVLSSTTGPFDLSTASSALTLLVDQGVDLVTSTNGGTTVAGTITVNVSAGTWPDGTAAATTDQIVTWLNANTAFKARAIAYNQAGKVGIRSRNLGRVYGIQLQASDVATKVFGGDVTIHMPTGSTASNKIAYNTAGPASNDPKVAWSAAKVTYTLDPVDDLAPGTYVVDVEIGDRGRVDNDVYKTPTVAKLAFQVKTATEEEAPAGNCDTCHQSASGKGFILDYARHHKIFDNTALDQCGACHDYMPQTAVGATWPGAKPISKRVHAVHYGSSLTYPVMTVAYNEGNRFWDITFPQDVRNCETCHPVTTTSGSWATKPARLPCSGCHDTDEATTHMKLMTYDPTPTNPWSGDEQESCKACH